jgi:3-dehydroquinate synthase
VSPRLRADVPSRPYDVVVERGALAGLGAALVPLRSPGKAVVCCDENVAPLYLDATSSSMAAAGFAVTHVVVPAGEAEKTLARAAELYGVLYDRGVRRGDVVVALGGGVIGDLAGFVAATFLRGVGLVQVPTTLLAQVDAAVGGKVAVDFRAGKNYVGTFYQPLLVVADPATLVTLPPRELRSGAAEVVKYGFLAGGGLLEQVEALADVMAGGAAQDAEGGAGGSGVADGSRIPGIVRGVAEDLISGCVAEKLAVVARDEREELGERAVLNLGHTVGHAIEAATGFRRYSHGEAVGLGLRATLWLSERLCGLSGAEVERGLGVLDAVGLPLRFRGATAADVGALTGRDKKSGADGVGFVLLEGFGRPRLRVPVPAGLLEEVVTWLSAP